MPNMTREEKALINIAGATKEITTKLERIVASVVELNDSVSFHTSLSIRPCWYKTAKEKRKAIFHGMIQETKPKRAQDDSPFTKTFALLEFEDGTLKRADIESVIFVDDIFSVYKPQVWEDDEPSAWEEE